MKTGFLHAGALSTAVGAAVAACLCCGPASAGDNVQVVPVFSDNHGNQGWVEFENAGERTKATPFVSVDEEGLKKALEHPEEKGTLALPVPRLMRLVDRVRQAIRGMKRPTANAPACPDTAGPARPNGVAAAPPAPAGAAAPETPPGPQGSPALPARTDTDASPPPEALRAATR